MTQYTIEQIMTGMPAAFVAENAGSITAVVQFHFTGSDPSDWYVKIDEGACSSHQGVIEDPNVSMTVESEDFIALLTGDLEPMTAFMRGRLNLRGDVGLAMKLPNLFDRSAAE